MRRRRGADLRTAGRRHRSRLRCRRSMDPGPATQSRARGHGRAEGGADPRTAGRRHRNRLWWRRSIDLGPATQSRARGHERAEGERTQGASSAQQVRRPCPAASPSCVGPVTPAHPVAVRRCLTTVRGSHPPDTHGRAVWRAAVVRSARAGAVRRHLATARIGCQPRHAVAVHHRLTDACGRHRLDAHTVVAV